MQEKAGNSLIVVGVVCVLLW